MPSSRLSSRGALVSIWLALCCAPLRAEAREAPDRVSVLTMGPGDHPFTRFGHNAILLQWGNRRDAVYNFGTFEFDGVRGAEDFMAGRFRYWLSVGTLASTLRAYGVAQRELRAQELSLTLAERAQLSAALEENARPERRYYAYDYYRDNCSTRVRDTLDALLGGALQEQVRGSGRLTYRQHTLRLVGEAPLLYFGLDSALGRPTDRAISRWEELFLPQELHDELARARRPGTAEPLVRGERVLLRSVRPAAALSPPQRAPLYAAVGASLGGGLAALGFFSGRVRAARIGFGALTAALGLSLGLLGSALLVFALSKHWAAHDNVSLLGCPPWALALAVYGAQVARGRVSRVALGALLGASLLTSLVLVVLALPPPHEALRPAALFIPLWGGWLYGGLRATRKLPVAPDRLAPQGAIGEP